MLEDADLLILMAKYGFQLFERKQKKNILL